MALPADYISGTITLTNGSPDFTGTGTGWQAADFREGDILLGVEDHAGQVYVIEAITGNAAGTLTQAWAGSSGTYTYRMRYEWDSSRVSAQARAMVELLGNGNLESIASLTGPGVVVLEGPHSAGIRPFTDFINGVAYDVQVDTLADRAAYDGQTAGFAVLVSDVGDGRSAIYSKASNTSGDWTDPAYVTGPTGALPEVTVGDVTTGAPGTDVEVVATPTMTGVELDFTIPAGEGFSAEGNYSGGTTYAKGDVVQQGGSSWVALQATTGNAPPTLPTTSNAYWQLLARQGVDGAGTVSSVEAGTGVSVNSADPTAPVVALANMANATVKGRNSSGTGAPEDVTMTQLLALLKAVGAYAKDNIIGSVAFSGGANTGAGFETGSNANGKYIRFADGTQICFAKRTTPSIALNAVTYWGGYASSVQYVTFPAAFVGDAPSVTASTSGSGANGAFSVVIETTVAPLTQFEARFTRIDNDNYSDTKGVSYVAVGRWRT